MKDSIYYIAELSANHNGSLNRALEIVDAVADAGASAIKLQTYTPDTMTRPGLYTYKGGLWDGRDLYDLYTEGATPLEWHKPIFERAKQRGLEYFSSPFHPKFISFLEDLGVHRYKIASFECTYLDLISKCTETKKPIIISTGLASLNEITRAYQTVRTFGGQEVDLSFLKCTSSYPAPEADSNLKTIEDLAYRFPDCTVGLSDHTLGIAPAIASVALGSRIIEKHVTLKREDGGIDSKFSLEPDEFKEMVRSCDQVLESLGGVKYGPTNSDRHNLILRRSIHKVDGKELILRPSNGLPLPDHVTGNENE